MPLFLRSYTLLICPEDLTTSPPTESLFDLPGAPALYSLWYSVLTFLRELYVEPYHHLITYKSY